MPKFTLYFKTKATNGISLTAGEIIAATPFLASKYLEPLLVKRIGYNKLDSLTEAIIKADDGQCAELQFDNVKINPPKLIDGKLTYGTVRKPHLGAWLTHH